MKVKYFTQIAVASVLGLGLLAGCNSTPTESTTPSSPAADTANPCAAKDKKDNPCAAKDNPCAAKDKKDNPCAAKESPAASPKN